VPGVPPGDDHTVTDDPIQRAILAHALTVDTIRNADAVAIVAPDNPTPADKRTAAAAIKALVRDGWLAGGRGIYRATEHARIGPHDTVVMSDTAADDPLGRYNGPDPIARVNAIVARIDAMRVRGLPIDPELEEQVRLARAVHAGDDWRNVVPALFPSVCYAPFAEHHVEVWEWANEIELHHSPRPLTTFWSRGHAKSSFAEMVAVLLGHRRVRRYCLYVSGKQSKADDHVASIGELLESPEIEAIDPELCERDLGKYGASKGWRRNRLTTQAGFTIDAVGLDSDVRGARIGTQRPDLLIFDDIDGSADSPATTEKKIERITKDVMPARDPRGVAILFVQNIIHSTSIAARLAELDGAPKASFLTRRKVSGPIPAVRGLRTEERMDEEVGRLRTVITGGEATWPEGFGLEACQEMIDEEGIVAFLSECQHEQGTLTGTMFDGIDWAARTRPIDHIDVPERNENGTWRGPSGTWVDPAVTSKDGSDSCAVVTDGWDPVGRFVWRLYAWERVASPEEAILNGLEAAMTWGSQVLGCEVDQGGDTWEVVYRTVVNAQMADPSSYTYIRNTQDGVPIPAYEQRRATSDGQMSKRQRIATMQARYTTDLFRHLAGGGGGEGGAVLEAGRTGPAPRS
jgi:hypothetical protein